MRQILYMFFIFIFLSCHLFESKKKSAAPEKSSNTTNKKVDTVLKTPGVVIVPDQPTTINDDVLKSFTQSNAFYYLTQGGASFRADIVKWHIQDAVDPVIRFRHTNVATGETHYGDFIDYVTDNRKTYRAWIFYDFNEGRLKFDHAIRKNETIGKHHPDILMKFMDNSSCNWNLKFEPCSLNQLRNRAEIIKVNQTLLGCPKQPQPSKPIPAGTGPRYSINKSDPNNWIVTYETYARVLFHPSRDYFPAVIYDFNPTATMAVKPGQWVEMLIYINGSTYWSLATDLDRR